MGKIKAAGVALLALAAAVLIALATGSPGAFAATDAEPICGTWKLRGAVGTYPEISFTDAPEGAAVNSASKVTLAKAEDDDTEDAGLPGVEFAAYDLEVSLPDGGNLVVFYRASEALATSAGAVRLFAYRDRDADTINEAPDWSAVAEAQEGQLQITLPPGATLGTVGVTYDGSNVVRGTVVFEDMTINIGNAGHSVSFVECEAEATPSATASAQPTTQAPTTRPTSASPTGTPSTLPVTGSGGGLNPLVILLPMAAALIGGGVGFALMRRRRDNPTFTAE